MAGNLTHQLLTSPSTCGLAEELEKENTDVPETGDRIFLPGVTMLLAVSVLAVLFMVKRKPEENLR